MMQLATVLCLCLTVALSNAFLWGGPAWNDLKVRFDINPFNSPFSSVPRTVSEAASAGWKRDTSAGGCGIAGTYFNGDRYRKDGDQGVMLLFDKAGYIAGIQAGIPKTLNYPKPNNAKYHVFNEEKDMWVTTAYFTNPASICTAGRTKSQYDNEGTGTMLAIQVGKSPSQLMKIPMEESQVLKTTKFTEGNCFYTMGKHYWYNLDVNMSCDDTFPVFLLYNGGKLNAFGWAFNPDYSNSKRWEHPDKSKFGMFMKTPPTCLGKDAPVSTLHIYMTGSPLTNVC